MPKLKAMLSRLSESMGGKSTHMTSIEDLGLAFHQAAIHGHRRRLKRILQTGLLVDYPNDTGKTALFCACFEGQAKVVRYLLGKGANPNIKNHEGATPVHSGAYSGVVSIVHDLVTYGADLRLHDNKQRSIRDWAELQPDNRKKTKMLEFLDRIRNVAMSNSGSDLACEKQPNEFYESLKAEESHSLMHLFRRKSLHRVKNKKATVQNLGFGKVYMKPGDEVGAVASIPLVTEGQLQHDAHGLTYNNGPFMVCESMTWDKTLVTAKRLHKKPLEGGVVDLLINEYEHMSQLRHPSILLLMGLCNTNNMDGLVLIYERISLGSLYHYMHHLSYEVTPRRMLTVMHQLCDGLLYLHQHNLIHCWITSHAVQLTSPTSIKLGNLEYMIHNVNNEGILPRSDVVNNKYVNAAYNWMAPEIMAGEQASELSDIYSLCSVMWEIIHGVIPWGGLHAEDIMCDLLELGKCLPLDIDLLGRTLHTILATALSQDLTVRSTMSVSRMRYLLGHLQDDRDEKIQGGTSASQLNQQWGSGNLSLVANQSVKDKSTDHSTTVTDKSPGKSLNSTLNETKYSVRDASLSINRYSVDQSTLKASTLASHGSVMDRTMTPSPSKETRKKKRTAPSLSSDTKLKKSGTGLPSKPSSGSRNKVWPASLNGSESSPKAFTRWTQEDDLETRNMVDQVKHLPVTKAPKSASAPRLVAQPFVLAKSNIDSIPTTAPATTEENANSQVKRAESKNAPSVPKMNAESLSDVFTRKTGKNINALKGLLQAAGVDKVHHPKHQLQCSSERCLVDIDYEHAVQKTGNFKPASHRQSMEQCESLSDDRRRRSICMMPITFPSQTGSYHTIIPPSPSKLRSSALPEATASLPRSFSSSLNKKRSSLKDIAWDQYRMDRYQQLLVLKESPGKMARELHSSERVSPRDMKNAWFEGSGSIQNLISEFQKQWQKHEQHQAILVLKSKKNLHKQPACQPYARAGLKETSAYNVVKENILLRHKNRKSFSPGNEDCSKIGRGSKTKRYDVEEFYFDDEINPNLPQERHLRLEATVNLSCDMASSTRNDAIRNMASPDSQDHLYRPNVTPSESSSSIKYRLSTPSASQESMRSEDDKQTAISESKVFPLRRESLHIIHIEDSMEHERKDKNLSITNEDPEAEDPDTNATTSDDAGDIAEVERSEDTEHTEDAENGENEEKNIDIDSNESEKKQEDIDEDEMEGDDSEQDGMCDNEDEEDEEKNIDIDSNESEKEQEDIDEDEMEGGEDAEQDRMYDNEIDNEIEGDEYVTDDGAGEEKSVPNH